MNCNENDFATWASNRCFVQEAIDKETVAREDFDLVPNTAWTAFRNMFGRTIKNPGQPDDGHFAYFQ